MSTKPSTKKRTAKKASKRTFKRSVLPSTGVVSLLRPLNANNSQLCVQRTYQSYNLEVGTTASTGSGYMLTFTANNLPGWGAWGALFEQFQLREVTVEVIPTFTQHTMAGSLGGTPLYSQFIHSALPLTVTTPPTAASQIMNDRGYEKHRMCSSFKRTFKPIINRFVAPANSVTGLSTDLISDLDADKIWLATNTGDDMPYNGIRLYLDSVSTASLASQVTFNVYVTYKMNFRGLVL